MNKKIVVLLLALVLVFGCAVGGTLAWLMDSTDSITNTFTIGDIDIELEESTGSEYTMVPGVDIAKDPTVTVKSGSEKCWLFVKIDETDNFDTYLTYTVASGWTELEAGVYYREVEKSDADQSFAVLEDNKVSVLDSVTKEMLNGLGKNLPTLTFTAYAIQNDDNFTTAAAAWAEIDA